MPIITYRQAIAGALREELARDQRVFLIGEKIGYGGGAFGVTAGMLAEFGERRVRDAPPADASLVAIAIGAAIGGLAPVLEMRSCALALAASGRLMSDRRLAIVIRAPLGGDGALASISISNGDPAVRVIAPVSPADAKGMLKAAVRQAGPVIVLEHRELYGLSGEVPADPDWIAPLEGARILREGAALTIVAYSHAVEESKVAAAALAERGAGAEIIDLRALAPLDTAAVAASIAKTGRAIIAGEGTPGAAAELAAAIYRRAFQSLRAPIEIVSPARASDIVNAAARLL
ncbi:MAG: transketolase C-terminal domain-containing protein [Candidatus Binataceae bacterium]